MFGENNYNLKNILILDSEGMSGHLIRDYFKSLNKYKIISIPFLPKFNNFQSTINDWSKTRIESLILENKPDIIINCLRILIDESEKSYDYAKHFNANIPKIIESYIQNKKIKLIQLSTDCVFSGEKGKYDEFDAKDGISNYSKTKSSGEVINSKDLTIRTSYIGPNINGRDEELFHWFLTQSGEIEGYANVFWSGVTTLELAKSIEKFIFLDISGIYHLTSSKSISKYDLLKLIKDIWSKDNININKNESIISDKSLRDNRGEIKPRNYDLMFNQLKEWMFEKKDLYEIYNLK